MMRLIFGLVLVAISHAHPNRTHIYNSTAGIVWKFETENWIENLAVRSNGEILATSLNRAALYLVNPFGYTTTIVHQFDTTDGLLGISEILPDVFAVASANSLATMGKTGIVLLADAHRGIVWRVDTNTGKYSIVIQNEIFEPSNPRLPLGLDGIHIRRNFLYFTNLGSNVLGQIAITADGSPDGPIEMVAPMPLPDDFCIARDGTAYVAGANTTYRVGQDLKLDVLVGGGNSSAVIGATSAQLGRTKFDRHVLYVGTNGGILAPLNGKIQGGQIVAVDTRQPVTPGSDPSLAEDNL